MESKIEVNRLEKDELSYELAVRGVTDKTTVKEMRTCLRAFLKLERHGSPITYPKYPYAFEDDKAYLDLKLTELIGLVAGCHETEQSPMYLKISSKLAHAFFRAQRSIAKDDEQHRVRSTFLVEFINLQSKLKSHSRKARRRSGLGDTPTDLSVMLSSTGLHSSGSESSDSDAESLHGQAAPNLQQPHSSSSQHCSHHPVVNTVPVSKWNITKFDGDRAKISLSAFLENIEELCLSRNVSKDMLFNSASDLFMGKALLWFRSIRGQVANWEQLVNELRAQFQPPNFNEKLFQEIRSRTQGSTESIGMYIAIMTNMFNRLTIPVNEEGRLKILLHNISPFYQSQLGLVQVNSISHLLELGRKLEAKKETLESFVPPPRNRSQLMEPDLAYVYSESGSSSLAPTRKVSQIDEIAKCWNCDSPGHRANKCRVEPRKRYCFKCGNPGQTVRTCTKCGSRSGNGRREH